MRTPREWRPGTGEYEGMVWDGRRWRAGGEAVAVTPWQRVPVQLRAVIATAVVIGVGLFAWYDPLNWV